jgi:hypothetical protein
MNYEMKPLPLNAAALDGLSERLILSRKEQDNIIGVSMLKSSSIHLTLSLALITFAGAVVAEIEPTGSAESKITFDNLPPGTLPPGWRIDATNPDGKLAEWKVVRDEQALSKPNVLTVTKINDTSSAVFNLYWTSAILFQDGSVEVSIRANTGKEDQGGGVIWRAKDGKNYYIARYNPLESNFRIYYVKDGNRKQLASASGITIPAGQWFRLKIVHHGDRIAGYLEDKKYLEVSDNTFLEAGGVGLWTKADAASSFDNLIVMPGSRR